jgi:hypothetical protein
VINPFAILYAIDNWVVERRPRNPFTTRGGFLVASLIAIGFWLIIFGAFKLLLPAAAIARWLNSNWLWLPIVTVIAYLLYSFGRMVADARTIVSGSVLKAGERRYD